MMRTVLIISSLVLLSFQLKAQDIHFSQFDQSYLNLNPGLTGQFDGNYRLNANYKNQWSAISEPYRTFSFAADARSPLKKYKNIHLGVLLFNDDAGVGGLRTTQFSLNVAYYYALNKDSSLSLNTGVQFGLISRSINFEDLSFDQQYNLSLIHI